jgi:hypothetical protein
MAKNIEYIPVNKSGSDFAPAQFTPDENKQWAKLLVQLRSFEAEVCHTIRNIEKKLMDQEKNQISFSNQGGSPIPNEAVGIVLEGKFYPTLLEGKLEMLEDMFKLLNKDLEEKYDFLGADLDVAHGKLNDLEKTIQNLKSELDILPPLEMSVRLLESDMSQSTKLIRTMGEAIENAEEEIKNNKARIEALETRFPNGDEFFWNGHSQIDFNESSNLEIEEGEEINGPNADHHTNRTHDINNPPLNGNLDEPGENDQPGDPIECEVMSMDPFMNGTQIGTYDGNPAVSFSRWIQRFQDVLSLMTTHLSEEQKLNRLKICLVGRARAEFDSLHPRPANLAGAIEQLKAIFENSNTRSIAKQALSICRQAPGERIYNFANRLNDSIRIVMVGEPEDVIQNRLLDEFLDRLVPDLQFEVK